ncbi:MAG: hypothetical protein EXS55_01825 [Candidatus Magasanikbacteria bacterium]|nr:hypothetical protein [Candidatus Magasanikbacteria bacterium]
MLSISNIISQAWLLYSKNWRALSIYMAFLFLPTFLMSILGIVGVSLNKVIPGSALVSNIIIGIIFIISLLITFWTTIALTCGLKAMLDNAPNHSWRAMFDKASPLLWPFAYTSLIVGLVVFGGTILFIIPGIIFTVWYAFTGYVVLFDGEKGAAALSASKRLVVGRWWPIIFRLIIPNLLFMFIFMAAQMVVAAPITAFLPTGPALVAANIVSALGKAILTPLTGAAILILFLDAKQKPNV